MAVLLRVIEETPRPIRDINNEIPDWLCDIIAKLHAKKPEERYQSAREVADVLGARLAEVQFSGRAGRVSDRREAPATLAGNPRTPVAHVPRSPRNSAKWIILLVAAVLLLAMMVPVALIALYYFSNSPGVTESWARWPDGP